MKTTKIKLRGGISQNLYEKSKNEHDVNKSKELFLLKFSQRQKFIFFIHTCHSEMNLNSQTQTYDFMTPLCIKIPMDDTLIPPVNIKVLVLCYFDFVKCTDMDAQTLRLL